MKYCPLCKTTYSDVELNCQDDGVELLQNVCTNPECEEHTLEEGLSPKIYKCNKCVSLTTTGKYREEISKILD